MDEIAVSFNRMNVTPGGESTGFVQSNVEGKARSLTIRLVSEEGGYPGRVFSEVVVDTPEGLSDGQVFPFSFPVPLEAAPMFRCTHHLPGSGQVNSGDRWWAVSASVDRFGRDHHASRPLDVVAAPPGVAATALVTQGEIDDLLLDPERGVNSAQLTKQGLAAMFNRANPADAIAVSCDVPVVRRGGQIIVDVTTPEGLQGDCSVGLFLYEDRPARSDLDFRFEALWSSSQIISTAGSSHVALEVPSHLAPTHLGNALKTWWDVRPCHGSGADEPSQRVSHPVVVRA